jgi:Uma2 family endonuclease
MKEIQAQASGLERPRALSYARFVTSAASPDGVLPAVDQRLVAPESRYEIEEGRVQYVAPADEPHGTRHSKISALVEAHAGDDYEVASDMLTRTSVLDDVAPDVSVFPRERNAETGGRQLEQLAFEVASTQSLSDAARKAQKLTARGVRRVFVIDVERQRALEWSRETNGWGLLDGSSQLEDPALAVPLPIAALVSAAKADDAVARALLLKRNQVLEAALASRRREGKLEGKTEGKAEGKTEGKAEGKAEAVLAVLAARGVAVSGAQRERILGVRSEVVLDRWVAAAITCATVDELNDE